MGSQYFIDGSGVISPAGFYFKKRRRGISIRNLVHRNIF